MISKRFVAVISGASGSGKTTLTKQVAALLGDAVTLHFDDYQPVAEYPTDLVRWVEEGRDLNAWQIPQLRSDLARLRSGGSITLPAEKGELQSAAFIVLEEPSGRERSGMRELIDFVVLVDLPLEIALSRKVVQDLEFCLTQIPPEKLAWAIQGIANYYTKYELAREYYLTCIERVRSDSDRIVDGRKSIEELAREIAEAVKAAATNTIDV